MTCLHYQCNFLDAANPKNMPGTLSGTKLDYCGLQLKSTVPPI